MTLTLVMTKVMTTFITRYLPLTFVFVYLCICVFLYFCRPDPLTTSPSCPPAPPFQGAAAGAQSLFCAAQSTYDSCAVLQAKTADQAACWCVLRS